MNIVIKKLNITSNGINIANIEDITINGPNGMYSFDFFILAIINSTLNTAPNKNDITEIARTVFSPKNSPKCPH